MEGGGRKSHYADGLYGMADNRVICRYNLSNSLMLVLEESDASLLIRLIHTFHVQMALLPVKACLVRTDLVHH